jgi:hypothetical protein
MSVVEKFLKMVSLWEHSRMPNRALSILVDTEHALKGLVLLYPSLSSADPKDKRCHTSHIGEAAKYPKAACLYKPHLQVSVLFTLALPNATQGWEGN